MHDFRLKSISIVHSNAHTHTHLLPKCIQSISISISRNELQHYFHQSGTHLFLFSVVFGYFLDHINSNMRSQPIVVVYNYGLSHFKNVSAICAHRYEIKKMNNLFAFVGQMVLINVNWIIKDWNGQIYEWRKNMPAIDQVWGLPDSKHLNEDVKWSGIKAINH